MSPLHHASRQPFILPSRTWCITACMVAVGLALTGCASTSKKQRAAQEAPTEYEWVALSDEPSVIDAFDKRSLTDTKAWVKLPIPKEVEEEMKQTSDKIVAMNARMEFLCKEQSSDKSKIKVAYRTLTYLFVDAADHVYVERQANQPFTTVESANPLVKLMCNKGPAQANMDKVFKSLPNVPGPVLLDNKIKQ